MFKELNNRKRTGFLRGTKELLVEPSGFYNVQRLIGLFESDQIGNNGYLNLRHPINPEFGLNINIAFNKIRYSYKNFWLQHITDHPQQRIHCFLCNNDFLIDENKTYIDENVQCECHKLFPEGMDKPTYISCSTKAMRHYLQDVLIQSQRFSIYISILYAPFNNYNTELKDLLFLDENDSIESGPLLSISADATNEEINKFINRIKRQLSKFKHIEYFNEQCNVKPELRVYHCDSLQKGKMVKVSYINQELIYEGLADYGKHWLRWQDGTLAGIYESDEFIIIK